MSKLLQEAISDFLTASDQRGLSRGSLYLHGYYLENLREWSEERGMTCLDDLTTKILREWGSGIRRIGWKPATMRNAVRSVRQFLCWCAEEGLMSDQSRALSLPRVPRRIQRTTQPDEVQRLLAVCDVDTGETVDSRRSAAIVCLLFDSLVRASELMSLRIVDVDLERRMLSIRGKRGDWRVATFSQQTAARLAAWLEVRPSTAKSQDALFVNLSPIRMGEPLGRTGVRDLLRDLAERAGIAHLSPHAFRRGGACELARQNCSTRGIMAKGGWSTLDQVERYTQALSLELLFPDANPMNGVGK